MSHGILRLLFLVSLGVLSASELRGEWFSRCVYSEDFEGGFPTNAPGDPTLSPRRNPSSQVGPGGTSGSQHLDLLPGTKTDPAIAWTSLPFPVQIGRHYRLTFEAKTRAPILWGVSFRDAQGKPLNGDHNTGIEPCEEWTPQTYYFIGKYPGVEGALSFYLLGPEPAAIDNIRIQLASPSEERAWYRQLAEQMKPIHVTPPESAGRLIPRTLSKLSQRGPYRIVFFGDSIANDISNSSLGDMLKDRYPRAKIEIRFAGRGGTSWMQNESFVAERVLANEPDLVILLAISNDTSTMLDPLARIVRKIRAGAPQAEVLLVTPHIFPSKRTVDPWEFGRLQRGIVLEVAEKESVEVVDLSAIWQSYLTESGKPPAWLLRDAVHMNERGRLLAAYAVLAHLAGSERIADVKK
jgi:lysophospholipase L1-like esterase